MLAALLYLSAPITLVYGNFLQVATYLEFATLGSVFFAQSVARTGRWRDYLGCGAFIGLITLTRITGLFIVPLLVVYILVHRGFRLRTLLALALAGVTSLVPVVVQGLYYLHSSFGNFFERVEISRQVVKVQNQTEGMDAKSLFFYLTTLFRRDGFDDYRFFGAVGVTGLLALAWGLARRLPAARVFATWYLLYLCLLTFVPTSLHPYTPLIRNVRYGIVFVLPLVALIAIAAGSLVWNSGRWRRGAGLLVLATVFVANIACDWSLVTQHRARWVRESTATRRLLDDYPGRTVYVTDWVVRRRVQYHSGSRVHPVVLRSFKMVRSPGVLLLRQRVDASDGSWALRQPDVKRIVDGLPPSWVQLADYGFFSAWEVPAYADWDEPPSRYDAPLGDDFEVDLHPCLVTATEGAKVEYQTRLMGDDWVGNTQVAFVSPAGGKADITLRVERSGTYDLALAMARGPQQGVVQVRVGGQTVASADLYRRRLQRSTVEAKGVRLTSGPNVMKLVFTTRNSRSKGYGVGLDTVSGHLVAAAP